MNTAVASSEQEVPPLPPPQPVYNCPECSHYLPEGSLACPECHALAYAGHMREIALRAGAQEEAKDFAGARDTWHLGLNWLPPNTRQYAGVEEHIAKLEGRLRGAEENKAKWTRRLGPFAPVIVFLSKAKAVLFFLFKAKFLLSFLVYFGFYWGLFGWKFASGLVVSILIHEMGHYVAARRRGLKVDLPVFIPGMGAYVRWYSQGVSLDDLSTIALAGPFFGLISAIVFTVLLVTTHYELWSALAHIAALLNLINLTPVLGLDGAQATYALNKTQRWLVLATTLIFFGMLHQFVYLVVAAGMVWRLFTNDLPEQPHTKTLLRFVLLLFALGVISYLCPDTRSLGRF